MMWNFLVGGLLAGADDRALRRPAGPGSGCGTSRPRRGVTTLRHERRVHRRVDEGGRRRPEPWAGAARGRLDRARRCRSRASSGCTSASRTCGSSRPAAAPTCAPRSWAAARCCRCTRASCRRAAWARRWRRGARTGARWSDEVGELVITKPMPSMPIYFWDDPDGERYRSSYFEMFPGVWRHGDWIKITERGTAVIYGRSDSTINRGGVRMGTSEIYSAVEGVRRGARQPGRGRRGRDDPVRRGARPARPTRWSPRSAGACASTARRGTCPTAIVQIPEVPRTLSNKKLEVPVKKILLGAAPESAASAATRSRTPRRSTGSPSSRVRAS